MGRAVATCVGHPLPERPWGAKLWRPSPSRCTALGEMDCIVSPGNKSHVVLFIRMWLCSIEYGYIQSELMCRDRRRGDLVKLKPPIPAPGRSHSRDPEPSFSGYDSFGGDISAVGFGLDAVRALATRKRQAAGGGRGAEGRKMAMQVTGVIAPDARRRLSLDAGEHALITDAPTENGGAAAGPSPFLLVLAGLAACTGITLRRYAERQGGTGVGLQPRVAPARAAAQDHAGAQHPLPSAAPEPET